MKRYIYCGLGRNEREAVKEITPALTYRPARIARIARIYASDACVPPLLSRGPAGHLFAKRDLVAVEGARTSAGGDPALLVRRELGHDTDLCIGCRGQLLAVRVPGERAGGWLHER